MSVWRRRLANGKSSWVARYGKKGRTRSFATKADAQDYETQQRVNAQRRRAGLSVQLEPITVRELSGRFLSNQGSTEKWRASLLRPFLEDFGDALISEIKADSIGSWLHARDESPKTKQHRLATIRQLFQAGVDLEYLLTNPARSKAIKPPGQRRVRPINPFASLDEVDAVAAALGEPTGSYVQFCVGSGLRSPSEAMRVSPSWINRESRTMFVDGSKTAHASRSVPLGQYAWEALMRVPWPLRPDDPFWSFDYEGWRRHAWPKALRTCGLTHRSPYEMRHSTATLLLDAGGSIEAVHRMLGHKDFKVTLDFYRRWTPTSDERLRASLDAMPRSASGAGASRVEKGMQP